MSKERSPSPCTHTSTAGRRTCKSRTARYVVADDERYCHNHADQLAQDLARLFVKDRDHYQCVACGARDDTLQWAHIHTRGAPYIRFDPENALTLCARCHYNFTMRPHRWTTWLEVNRPGLWTRLTHREIAGEASGHSVDLAEVICEYRSWLTV